MTIDEAIKTLEELKTCVEEGFYEISLVDSDKEAFEIAIEELKPRGSYECFHCLNKTVIWDNDFTYEEFGVDGEGFVHVCHCASCGAEILYFITTEAEQ